ncbi:pyruvate dehydrogenase (acetyl-transferring), homodimeric type [Pseudomaricurvus alkylphenolicus]|uniref:pyruvate dehydrogenase (acetyl-transferring), homodimeric type n=1 Tax=Pseudomaricurvus alkylphenolicus TaxID=1306991 RepID=UPI001421F5CE|nr:pyruvate dehydrogenase (acetyl-transferring), homodimeric type [Pseudomaricurvus alkylphenolicus]NIB43410.1 pyruvate dehydrogenase (acetyl-transferring), homodimeric type [Pseudomaricurvus alkylphenolicus]
MTHAAIENPHDTDDIALENGEWIDAIDSVRREQGEHRSREILRLLQNHLLTQGVSLSEATLNTPYRNTIPPHQQPAYPGDRELEQKIENIIRWNAMAMVLGANDNGSGVGGHIATYQSVATALEVGFHHWFRARSDNYGGDILMVQAHAAPGIYARAYLEGRLTATQLQHFRRELQQGGGLPSYPHPRRLPDFWQLPSASMGLSTPSAIYQARFMKYLQNRGLKPDNGGKVWCFIGDGESDEPEVLGTINMAVREDLDNLVMVVNCNLQRLDGPVRGNGKIIQELERSYRGSGWDVIKVIWGGEWDELFARDHDGVLQARMDRAVDGDYQFYTVSDGTTVREHWIDGDRRLAQLMQTLSDDEIRVIRRGGHDRKKLYAAFERAAKSTGRPTAVLIKTVKGDGLGAAAEGQNTAHQKKQLSEEERIAIGRRFGIPLSDEQMARAELYKPESDSPEAQYLHQQRQRLDGYLPSRVVSEQRLQAPALSQFKAAIEGSKREQSTTMAFVRMLATLLKDKAIGRHMVPIVPDEARTFGMESLFKQFGIYSSEGQKYKPVDASTLLPYREAKDGQLLQEGICEAGAMASFLAAGTAYANFGVPMIPFYIFYSIFGFQRVGDMIWSCADAMAKGFLMGATAGRTTLNGEGLQHQDGHSHVLASTIPNLRSYDPAFAYELAVIVRDGIERMYYKDENIFYYLTLYNQNYEMPAMPSGVEEGIINGMYRFSEDSDEGYKVHLLGSGSLMQEVLAAVRILKQYHCSVDVWSVTSYTELQRQAQQVERQNLLAPDRRERNYIERVMSEEEGIVVACSDYMKSLANGISRWFTQSFTALGTDGFGLSESRPDLRRHFEVDANYIAWAALTSLFNKGELAQEALERARQDLNIPRQKQDPSSL